jgi:hypothetical protein
LRNPLASIAAGARLMLKAKTPEDGVRLESMMQSSVGRMAKMIDSVMDLARGRLGGGISLSRSITAIEPVLDQVVAELAAAHPERSIETHFELETPIFCDPARVAQLFSNLLGNAISHGAPDQPVRVDANTKGGTFELCVANGGTPISEEARKRLFHPFYRGAAHGRSEGLGLGLLVALLMTRPEIKLVSDLTNKNVAIDDRQSASNGIVRSAIAAAGATGVQLNEGHTKAIDRLISGEVPAAVLTLVSPEAAEWFPEIAGFKIFRIPLSPRSLQARLETAGNAAARFVTMPAKIADLPPKASAVADPNARKIQQQVTAATVIAEHVMTLRDAQKTAPATPNSNDLVVVLMARPEIKSISDLTGKDIAIDDRHSAFNDSVRTAIAAAGAAEVQLSEGQTKAIDRLISGEVPAAVLTLLYSETGFPQFAGFKIFRIPLSPRS